MRVNLGCGGLKLDGYINVDDAPDTEPDVCADVTDYLDTLKAGTVDEIYAGHFLEHLEHADGQTVLRNCWRVLKHGGTIGVTVPDTEAVAKLYVLGKMSLHDVCEQFLYSTVQPSRHRWSYDVNSLRRALEDAGFVTTKQIDRQTDRRVIPAWYQVGWDAEKP